MPESKKQKKDKGKMNSSGDVSSNMDIIIEKCRFLDFADQIKLASACVQLNNVLKTHIWKEKYQTLNIFEKSHEFELKNETNENGISVNSNEIQEFQKHYADKVHKLCIKNIVLHLECTEDLKDVLYGRMLRKNILNIGQFINLKSLTYRYMAIPRDHLKQIAEIIPHLEEFCLVNCSLEVSMDELLRDIVLQLKNLKTLSIEHFQRFRLKSCRFQEIVAMEKLEQLLLTAVLEPDEYIDKSNDKTIAPSANLKDLDIKITIDPLKWPDNPAFFRGLEALSILTFESVETINDSTLAVIAQVCPNLVILTIRSSDFEDIEQFPIGAKVTVLGLTKCRGLDCDNLRHLLTQLKISTFHSIETTYEGVFEGSRVSPFITSLRVDGINSQKLTFPYRKNKLEYLTWHDPDYNDEQTFSSKSLAWCTGLKALNIHNGYLPLETIMMMKSLHTLAIPQPTTEHNWSYITALLHHPSLKELGLRQFTNECQQLDLDVPTEAFPTNVTSLFISLDVFDVGLDFWMDLVTKNENLKKIWCSCNPHDKLDFFLAKLIYHPNFPESSRNIDINGFLVDCNDLRWDFAVTMKRLQNQIESSKCWYDNDKYRIILLI